MVKKKICHNIIALTMNHLTLYDKSTNTQTCQVTENDIYIIMIFTL